jgi:hypothetical protein
VNRSLYDAAMDLVISIPLRPDPDTTRTLRATLAFVVGVSLLSLVPLAGCSGDPNMPKLGRVHGKVTYKGKPVESGTVTFNPVLGKGGETGQNATGQIAADGTYEMTTFNTGDGAIVGEHMVAVVVREKGSENQGKPRADSTIDYTQPKIVTPTKYASVETSPLRFTVREGDNTFDIELKD